VLSWGVYLTQGGTEGTRRYTEELAGGYGGFIEVFFGVFFRYLEDV
jgi:hypothetical protein